MVQNSEIPRLVLHVGVQRAKYNCLSVLVALGSTSINSVWQRHSSATQGGHHKSTRRHIRHSTQSIHWQQDISNDVRCTVTSRCLLKMSVKSQITCILKNSDKSMMKLRKPTTFPQSIAGSATGTRIRYLPISKSVCSTIHCNVTHDNNWQNS
jgi:hypothetical protein